MRSFPRPQQPHPPIFLGGVAPQVFKRTVAYGNGWMPTRSTPELIRQGRAILNELAVDAGRDPKSITVLAYIVPAERTVLEALEEAGRRRRWCGLRAIQKWRRSRSWNSLLSRSCEGAGARRADAVACHPWRCLVI